MTKLFANVIERVGWSAAMRLGSHSPLGRAGQSGAHVVIGFGIEGRGPTLEDATAQWIEGARA